MPEKLTDLHYFMDKNIMFQAVKRRQTICSHLYSINKDYKVNKQLRINHRFIEANNNDNTTARYK